MNLTPYDIRAGALVNLTCSSIAAMGIDIGPGLVLEVMYCHPNCDMDTVTVLWANGTMEDVPTWAIETPK